MLGFSTNPTVILIMILLIFFIVTMFMESIATLTLFMPILYPIALGVGIDPIVLSVLITVVIGVGLVTPPVGMCIYVACDLMDVTVGEVFPTLVPFYCSYLRLHCADGRLPPADPAAHLFDGVTVASAPPIW